MKKNKAYNLFFAFLFLMPVIITLAYYVGLIVASNQTGTAPQVATFATAWNTTCSQMESTFGTNATLKSMLSTFLSSCGFSVGSGAMFAISWLLNIALIRLVCDVFFAIFGWVHSRF